MRALFDGLAVSGFALSTAVLLAGAGSPARRAEALAPRVPLGAFITAACDV